MKSLLFTVGMAAIAAVVGVAVAEQAFGCGGGCCTRPAVASSGPAAGCNAMSMPGMPGMASAVMGDEKPAATAKDAPAAKEVTLEGTIQCAKCSLKETKTCTTAIVVKEGDKNVTYYFADKGNGESYHENVCGGGKEAGTVTGKEFEKDGKMWITPTKVAYKK